MTKKVSQKAKGKSSGLGICLFIATLLEANELAPKKKKKTDEELAKRIADEYPGKSTAQRFVNGKRTVNDSRNRYNKGIFTRNIPPKVMSLRYNSKGEAVDGRTGNHRLYQEEIERLREEHNEYRKEALR